jgi:hypothetical protein
MAARLNDCYPPNFIKRKHSLVTAPALASISFVKDRAKEYQLTGDAK